MSQPVVGIYAIDPQIISKKPPSPPFLSSLSVCENLFYPQTNKRCSSSNLVAYDEGSGPRVTVVAGSGAEARLFKVHQSLLVYASQYFAGVIKHKDQGIFIETKNDGSDGNGDGDGDGVFSLDDVTQVDFRRWVVWLYSCAECKGELQDSYCRNHDCDARLTTGILAMRSMWCSNGYQSLRAVTDFMLGDRLLSPLYCRFALAALRQHVHLVGLDDLRYLLLSDECPLSRDSAMYRFLLAWVGWLKYSRADDDDASAGSTERESMAATYYDYADVYGCIEGWISRDPRGIPIEHWFEDCSRRYPVLLDVVNNNNNNNNNTAAAQLQQQQQQQQQGLAGLATSLTCCRHDVDRPARFVRNPDKVPKCKGSELHPGFGYFKFRLWLTSVPAMLLSVTLFGLEFKNGRLRGQVHVGIMVGCVATILAQASIWATSYMVSFLSRGRPQGYYDLLKAWWKRVCWTAVGCFTLGWGVAFLAQAPWCFRVSGYLTLPCAF